MLNIPNNLLLRIKNALGGPHGQQATQGFMPGESSGIPNEIWKQINPAIGRALTNNVQPSGGASLQSYGDDPPAPATQPPVVSQPKRRIMEALSPVPEPTLPVGPEERKMQPPLPLTQAPIVPIGDIPPASHDASGRPIRPNLDNEIEADKIYSKGLDSYEPWKTKKYSGRDRLKAALAQGLQGMGEMTLATGDWQAGLGAGAARAAGGAFLPYMNDLQWRDMEKQRIQGQMRDALAMQKAEVGIEGDRADIGLRNAQTGDIMSRPEREREERTWKEKQEELERQYKSGESQKDRLVQLYGVDAGLAKEQMGNQTSIQVAQMNNQTRKQIADANNAMRQKIANDKNQMDAEQFKARYPKVGQVIPWSQIRKQAEEGGVYPEDLAKLLQDKGAVIDPDK